MPDRFREIRMEVKMVDLKKSRDELDRIDRQITELMQERLEIVKDVAEYKQGTGKKVFDKKREDSKLEMVGALAEDDFKRQSIEELFRQIMSIGRKLQYGMIDTYEDTGLHCVKDLGITQDTKVMYFGEPGAYTEQAMLEVFGEEVHVCKGREFQDVMQAVHDGEVDYGVLAIENSSTGGITDNYDLFMKYDNTIVGEHVVKVEHALLGVKGAGIEDICKVYSHPQGIYQCHQFLMEHPKIKPYEYYSTSAGAKKVADEGDKTQAAIASKRAGAIYGLDVLAEAINFESENYTRFIIITNQRKYLKKANKISISFELPHVAGSLYGILSHIRFNGLNMTKIESRPIAGRNWEYRFFVDFEGNLDDSGVKNALNGIREEAVNVRILGNYCLL